MIQSVRRGWRKCLLAGLISALLGVAVAVAAKQAGGERVQVLELPGADGRA